MSSNTRVNAYQAALARHLPGVSFTVRERFRTVSIEWIDGMTSYTVEQVVEQERGIGERIDLNRIVSREFQLRVGALISDYFAQKTPLYLEDENAFYENGVIIYEGMSLVQAIERACLYIGVTPNGKLYTTDRFDSLTPFYVYKAVSKPSEANYIESSDTAWLYAMIDDNARRGEPFSYICYPDTAETLAYWENRHKPILHSTSPISITFKLARSEDATMPVDEFKALYENTWTSRTNPSQDYIDNDGIIPSHFKPLSNSSRDPVRDFIRAIDLRSMTKSKAARLVFELIALVEYEDRDNDR